MEALRRDAAAAVAILASLASDLDLRGQLIPRLSVWAVLIVVELGHLHPAQFSPMCEVRGIGTGDSGYCVEFIPCLTRGRPLDDKQNPYEKALERIPLQPLNSLSLGGQTDRFVVKYRMRKYSVDNYLTQYINGVQ
jgi:hypothetical protein